VGDFANFAVGCTFVLPASILYHAKPSRKSALIGMLVGTLVMTVFGSSFNALYLIPKFAQLFHVDLDTIIAMGTAVNGKITSVYTLVLYAVVPFNLLKGIVVSLLTFLLYKRISPLMHKGDARKKKA
jgi:riboflavin transporter FmnP